MKYLKGYSENVKFYDSVGVFIEPLASASDFSKFIDEGNFDFDSEEFWDNIDMWQEGNLSSRYSVEWCEKVISGKGGKYHDKKKEYYPAILKLLKDYDLKTIRFTCDW